MRAPTPLTCYGGIGQRIIHILTIIKPHKVYFEKLNLSFHYVRLVIMACPTLFGVEKLKIYTISLRTPNIGVCHIVQGLDSTAPLF